MSDGEPVPKRIRAERATTVCIRCSGIRNEFQFTNWLLWDNRVSLGIDEWFEVPTGAEGEDKSRIPVFSPPATFQFVYVSFSKRPYFLIEGSPDFLEKLFIVFGNSSGTPFEFKGASLTVEESTGATVASQKEKVASVDKIRAEKVSSTATAALPPVASPPAAAKMVPRSVRLASKRQ